MRTQHGDPRSGRGPRPGPGDLGRSQIRRKGAEPLGWLQGGGSLGGVLLGPLCRRWARGGRAAGTFGLQPLGEGRRELSGPRPCSAVDGRVEAGRRLEFHACVSALAAAGWFELLKDVKMTAVRNAGSSRFSPRPLGRGESWPARPPPCRASAGSRPGLRCPQS